VRPHVPDRPIGNQLLERLPAAERARVIGGCEFVELARGELIDAPGQALQHVYFPTASAISSLLHMEAGHMIEVSLTGHEGVHGAAAGRGSVVSLVRAEVQLAGGAWRMPISTFRTSLGPRSALGSSVDGYMTALVAQLARAAGCNRFHRVEQRVARWLLMTADRVRSATFPMTHEQLASVLGVRRVGVTNAAGDLQRRRLIAYARGAVAILDRKGLERASCDCYRADIKAYEQALPAKPSPPARRPTTPGAR
jgi:CRP-like cAMP-binding protein